jgi:hypothetical protein
MASFHNCRLPIVVGDLRVSKPWTEARWRRAFKARLATLNLHAIYVIGPGNGPLKIGYAKNVQARLSSIAMAHWEHDIELHFFCWCAGTVFTRALEKRVHLRFDDKRVRGEWFDVTADEAKEAIVSIARATKISIYTQESIDACKRAKVEAELIEALRL